MLSFRAPSRVTSPPDGPLCPKGQQVPRPDPGVKGLLGLTFSDLLEFLQLCVIRKNSIKKLYCMSSLDP